MTPCPPPTLANDRTSEKASLRKRLRAQRAQQDPADVAVRSARILASLATLIRPGAAIALFSPIAGEVQVQAAALRAAGAGRLAWPRVGPDRTMQFYACERLVPTGAWGILEPEPVDAVDPDQFDAVVVPGLAFTPAGDRLGMGAGHYDRFLPMLRNDAQRWAVAFDWQVVPTLPTELHDAKMTHVVTESRILVCSPLVPTQLVC